jgi:hypothetical protein
VVAPPPAASHRLQRTTAGSEPFRGNDSSGSGAPALRSPPGRPAVLALSPECRHVPDRAERDDRDGEAEHQLFGGRHPGHRIGDDRDHIAESVFTISPDHESKKYSELDYEYLPNGGWGAYGPRLDTTSWRDSATNDRVTKSHITKLGGWHTMVITVHDGETTYSIDGHELFSNGSKHSPREPMTVNFSTWFIGLPFKGSRSWDMQVDWLYYQADQAVSGKDAETAVAGLTADGTHYVNTLPKP